MFFKSSVRCIWSRSAWADRVCTPRVGRVLFLSSREMQGSNFVCVPSTVSESPSQSDTQRAMSKYLLSKPVTKDKEQTVSSPRHRRALRLPPSKVQQASPDHPTKKSPPLTRETVSLFSLKAIFFRWFLFILGGVGSGLWVFWFKWKRVLGVIYKLNREVNPKIEIFTFSFTPFFPHPQNKQVIPTVVVRILCRQRIENDVGSCRCPVNIHTHNTQKHHWL